MEGTISTSMIYSGRLLKIAEKTNWSYGNMNVRTSLNLFRLTRSVQQSLDDDEPGR